MKPGNHRGVVREKGSKREQSDTIVYLPAVDFVRPTFALGRAERWPPKGLKGEALMATVKDNRIYAKCNPVLLHQLRQHLMGTNGESLCMVQLVVSDNGLKDALALSGSQVRIRTIFHRTVEQQV